MFLPTVAVSNATNSWSEMYDVVQASGSSSAAPSTTVNNDAFPPAAQEVGFILHTSLALPSNAHVVSCLISICNHMHAVQLARQVQVRPNGSSLYMLKEVNLN